MATQQDKLSRFIQTIMDDVAREREEIFTKLEKEHEAAVSAAADRFLENSYAMIRERVAEIQMQSGRQISKKVLENNRLIFEARQDMERQLCEAVTALVAQFTAGPDYPAALSQMAVRFRDMLGGGRFTLYVRPADLCHAAAICAACPEACVQADDEILFGGAIAASQDGKRRIDGTYTPNA